MKSNISNNNNIKIILIFINIFLIVTYSNATIHQNQPMIKIYSSSQTINILTNTISFQGKVILKYQNISVYADTILVQNIKNKYTLPIIKAYGNPVTLHQIQKSDHIISAQALIVHYDANNNIIALIGNAYIKQEKNSIHSDNITYTIKDKKITATANQNNQVITTLFIKN